MRQRRIILNSVKRRKVTAIIILAMFITMSGSILAHQKSTQNSTSDVPTVNVAELHSISPYSTSSGKVSYTLNLPNNTLIKGNYRNDVGSPGPFSVTFDSFSNQIYVSDTSSNSLFVVNGTGDVVSSLLPVGYGVIRTVYDPANHYVYGAKSGSGAVVKIGIGGSVVQSIRTGSSPSAVMYNPYNDNIYVTNQASNNVSVISSKTNKVVQSIAVGDAPSYLAFDPVNHNVYVANAYSGNLTVINSTSNTVTGSIKVGTFPDAIGVDSANNMIYVANRNTSTLSVINGSSGTNFLTRPVGKYPSGIAYDPVNSFIYVTNFGSNTTSIINTTSDQVVGTMRVGGGPQDIVYDPVNNNLYVSNFVSTTLSIIGNNFNIYSVKFNETGLGPGNTWTVNLSDGQTVKSTGNAMEFQVPNGTFSYTVTTSNGSLSAKPSSSSFTVNGGSTSVTLKFVKSSFLTPVEFLAIISAIIVLAAGWGVFFAVMRIRSRRK